MTKEIEIDFKNMKTDSEVSLIKPSIKLDITDSDDDDDDEDEKDKPTKAKKYYLNEFWKFDGVVVDLQYEPVFKKDENKSRILPRLESKLNPFSSLRNDYEGMKMIGDYLLTWTDDLAEFWEAPLTTGEEKKRPLPNKVGGSVSGKVVTGGVFEVYDGLAFAWVLTEEARNKVKTVHMWLYGHGEVWAVTTANIVLD